MRLSRSARPGRALRIARATLLACACIPGAAMAGDLGGTVVSSSLDRPVRGARVMVVETGQSVSTDEDGRYSMLGLNAGRYTLRISQPGYEPVQLQVQVPETGAITADASIALLGAAAGDEIVVTGARTSRLLSIERKRSLSVVSDIVSSDGIGKLPDYNTAEALQRLPGISVEIDQSEPRYVVIRGVDPNLNQVMIDGNVVGIPEAEGRRVALDTIPSDLVGAIEVVKTVTPDYDANAIGGSINIVTPTAFDQSGPFTYVSGRGIYNEVADKLGFGASAMHGQVLDAEGTFGVVAGVSYSKRFIDTELVDPRSWEEVDDGFWAPTGMRYYDYSIMRERIGAILNLDWQPSDNAHFYLRNIYNEFTDHEGRDQFDYDMYRGDAAFPSANEVTYDRGRASREFRQNNQTQKLFNISPGAELTFGNIELDLNYTFAHAEEHTPVRDDIEFRTGSSNVSTIRVGEGLPTFTSIDEGLFDPEAYPLRRIRLRRETIDEDLHAAKADLTYNFSNASDSFLKTGVKFIDRTKDRDNYQEQWEPTQDVTFGDTGGVLPEIEGYYDGDYRFGPAMDYQGVLDYFYTQNPGLLELDEERTGFNDRASDYHINEQIYAGYAMASLELGYLTVVGGVRVEVTEGRYDAFAIRDTDGNGDIELSDIAPLSFKKSYTHVLPSVVMNYRPSPEVALRAAWTNTIGRPNYSDVVPTFEEEDGDGEAGNPNLQPYTSMGLDLSAEYYPDVESVFSLAMFYKRIDNPIYRQRILDTSFAGVDLLSLSQPQNADAGELFGVEANVVRRLTFLPGPLDGLGVSANVTFVDSEVTVPGRADKLPFFRQSKWIAGGALFYEKGPIEARVALNYRDDYLTGVGSTRDSDAYTGARTVLDARIAYRVMEGIELFGSVSNIGKEPLVEYQSVSDRIIAREAYGVNVDFGFSASF
ncbi:TonB-dependent receptor [Aurantiacibacter flavus]|uniref:TonB-dependent receptor n=1 Tax=Aurantiacibacter flavus TaxID=3145232 RepID=A0ABV0CV74_9SPHN